MYHLLIMVIIKCYRYGWCICQALAINYVIKHVKLQVM